MPVPRHVAPVLVVLLAACSGAAVAVGADGADGGSDTALDAGGGLDARQLEGSESGAVAEAGALGDGGKDAAQEANASSCPAVFSTPAGHCTLGVVCSYDEGSCECTGYCGGAAPPPDTDFSHWTCRPKLAGCPAAPPTSGAACNSPAAVCSYGSCCMQTFTCGQSGTWAGSPVACPP